jgi:RNA ligase
MNKELLLRHIEDRLVNVQKHPSAELYIYNYSQKVQFMKLWDEVTTITRGLIMDGDMNIIARPFSKFFNISEHKPEDIPNLPFEVYEKMDGCFRFDTPIQCWDGTTLLIGDIVNKKLTPTLIGMDEEGNLVPSKVIEHFDNGTKNNWLAITVDCPVSKKSGGANKPNIIRVTDNHHIFVNGKYKPAFECEVGDSISTFANSMPEPLLHIIKSGLLGDGCIVKGINGHKYSEPHTENYKEYVNYFKSIFVDYTAKRKTSVSGYGSQLHWFVTKEYPELTELRDLWYPEGKKIIPEDLSWVNDFTVAKWYMDDGSLIHSEKQEDRALFATNSFTEDECYRLGNKLYEMYQIDFNVHYHKGWVIRINKSKDNSITNFWEAIEPYIIPCMRYKLPLLYRDKPYGFKNLIKECKASFKLVEKKILSINKIESTKRNFPSGRKGFDIGTETKNYFAKGILVHNSLGIFYWLNDEIYIATKGSFNSDQSRHANRILHTKYKDIKYKMDKSKTYLVEIIYPENRIVCGYGEMDDLILIAVRDTATGLDLPLEDIGLPIVKRYDGVNDLSELKALEEENKEGFVVKFSNGFRVKVKFDEYIRLHRIVTGVSNLAVWEYLSEGKPFDELLDRVPDEFFNWLHDTSNELIHQYEIIRLEVEEDFYKIVNRKAFAEAAKLNKNTSLLFTRLNSYSDALDKQIWKMIRPEFSKPFVKIV